MALGFLFAFAAGSLSILSPCVLPLVPVVLGTAASEGRWGPVALAGGLVLSFVAIGMFVSLIGFSIGLDGDFFRAISAVMLLAVGLLLAIPVLQRGFALAAGPAGNWMQNRFGGRPGQGAAGQFGIGVLLGAVWSPCVGPTLGAASLLAAQGRDLVQVVLTMLAFGFGVAVPLLLLGLMSRELLMRWRTRMLGAGIGIKTAIGAMFVLTGAAILAGFDKQLEAAIVTASPAWLTALTTRY